MATITIYEIYPGSTPAQIVKRTIRKTTECMDRGLYSAARSFLEDTEEAIMILDRIVDNIESATQNRIVMMQERADAEGVVIVLNPRYTEDDLDVIAAELSCIICARAGE